MCETNHQSVAILDEFNKSTAHALEYDAKKNPEFVGTSKFVKFTSNIWKTTVCLLQLQRKVLVDAKCKSLLNDNNAQGVFLVYI